MHVATEQSWGFWEHWALEQQPSELLRRLLHEGRLQCHPELLALIDVPQDPQWHPEGDVWTHTLLVCDQAAAISRRERLETTARQELLFAALCHDLGKPAVTVRRDGRWRAPGHPQAGMAPAERLLARMGAPATLIDVVRPLVAEHLAHTQLELSGAAFRRLLVRLRPATLPRLVQLIEADLSGRPPLPTGASRELQRFAERGAALLAGETLDDPPQAPPPLIQGRHLIRLGYAPSVWFGEALRQCHAAQLQGMFADEQGGLAFLAQLLETSGRAIDDVAPQPPSG